MADPIDYDQLAPGIRETVRWLAGCGFDPCDSGDGVANPEAGMECAVDYPHVHMRVEPDRLVSECRRLHTLLHNRGIEVRDPTLSGPMPPCIEAGYSAGSGIATISLCGVDDAMLRESCPAWSAIYGAIAAPVSGMAGATLRESLADFAEQAGEPGPCQLPQGWRPPVATVLHPDHFAAILEHGASGRLSSDGQTAVKGLTND